MVQKKRVAESFASHLQVMTPALGFCSGKTGGVFVAVELNEGLRDSVGSVVLEYFRKLVA